MTTTDLTTLDHAGLEAALAKAGDTVKALKAKKVSKEEVQPAVDHLLAVKAEVKRRAEQAQKDGTAVKEFDRAALDALLAQRFFVAPSFQIYGGECYF